MNATTRIQNEVTAYIGEKFNTEPVEWLTKNRFVDPHGCDGYIFKNELAARRYVLGNIYGFGSDCESACCDEDWVNILVGCGMMEHNARRIVSSGQWEKVARKMLDTYGPAHFLSTYSGQVAMLDDCSLLYY